MASEDRRGTSPAHAAGAVGRYHPRIRGEIIGKPGRYGRRHPHPEAPVRPDASRLTGVAINHLGHIEYLLSTSEVRFRVIDDEEIRHYVMSGEPMDKAGAYGIRGEPGCSSRISPAVTPA